MISSKATPNFSFTSKGRFRIFNAQATENLHGKHVHNLLAVSNKFGVIFTAKGNVVKAVPSCSIRKHQVTKENSKFEIEIAHKNLELKSNVELLSINCDGSLLAVATTLSSGPFVLIFDINCFSENYKGPKAPMCTIRMPSAENFVANILALEWNPAQADTFVVCCSNGTICVIKVEDVDKFTIEGTSVETTPVPTCLSWSPKGKQIVVGYSDGSLRQIKHNCQVAKKIDPVAESVVGFPPGSAIDILWHNTNHFLVTYQARNDAFRVAICQVTVAKEHPPVFKTMDDVLFGSSTLLWPKYYMMHIVEWKLVVCSSSNSIESSIIGWNGESKHWEVFELDGESRAELPLNKSNQDTFPVGVGIDLIKFEDQNYPILLILSTEGLLCPFEMKYGHHENDILVKPCENLDIKTVAKVSKHAMAILSQIPNHETIPSAVPVIKSPEKPKNLVTKPEPVVEQPVDENMNHLRMQIYKQASIFDSNLKNLKIVLSHWNPMSNVNNIEQNASKINALLSQQDASAQLVCDGFQKTFETLEKLSIKLLEDRSYAEKCQFWNEKRRDEENYAIWRQKPLTPAQEEFLSEKNEKIRQNDEKLNELIEKLGSLTLEIMSNKNGSQKEDSVDLIYKTLANMQSIILVEKQQILTLKKANVARSVKLDESSKLDPSSLSTSAQNGLPTLNRRLGIKNNDTTLRRFLKSRKHVPQRTSIPVASDFNLSFSVQPIVPKSFSLETKKDVSKPVVDSSLEKMIKASKPVVAYAEKSSPKQTVLPMTNNSDAPATMQQKIRVAPIQSNKAPEIKSNLASTVPISTFGSTAPATRFTTTKPAPSEPMKSTFGVASKVPSAPSFTFGQNLGSATNTVAATSTVSATGSIFGTALKTSGSVFGSPALSSSLNLPKEPATVPPPSLTFGLSSTKPSKPAPPPQTTIGSVFGISKCPESKPVGANVSIIEKQAGATKLESPKVTTTSVKEPSSVVATVIAEKPTQLEKAATFSKPEDVKAVVVEPNIEAKPEEVKVEQKIVAKSLVGEKPGLVEDQNILKLVDARSIATTPPPSPLNDEVTSSAKSQSVPALAVSSSNSLPSALEAPKNKSAIPAAEDSMAEMEEEAVPPASALNFSFKLGSPDNTTTIQTPTNTSNLFSGGFFSGLGGTPKNDSKNVFGASPGIFGSPVGAAGVDSTAASSLFGSPKPAFSFTAATGSPLQVQPPVAGGFSIGAGSVAQQGFGSLAGGNISKQSGTPAFGGSASFGAAASFGTFGGTGGAGFGSGATFGAMASPTSAVGAAPSVFGASAATFGSASPPAGGGFAAFAHNNAPTFGSLAGGQSFGGFGTVPIQQQQQQHNSPPPAPSFSQWRK